jgi:hypothetical protein
VFKGCPCDGGLFFLVQVELLKIVLVLSLCKAVEKYVEILTIRGILTGAMDPVP